MKCWAIQEIWHLEQPSSCNFLCHSCFEKLLIRSPNIPKFNNIYQKDGSCDDLNNLNLNSEMPRSRELTGKIANDPPPPYSRPQFSGFLGNSFFHVQNLKPQYSTNQKIDGGFFNTAASLLVGEGIRYNNEGKMIPFRGFQFSRNICGFIYSFVFFLSYKLPDRKQTHYVAF